MGYAAIGASIEVMNRIEQPVGVSTVIIARLGERSRDILWM
ncbi:hypothetical protein [Paenibacillus ferrarius]|nr:hypothetical protein [Paenibacillus ferrarius]